MFRTLPFISKGSMNEFVLVIFDGQEETKVNQEIGTHFLVAIYFGRDGLIQSMFSSPKTIP